jgi:hypothetical protein
MEPPVTKVGAKRPTGSGSDTDNAVTTNLNGVYLITREVS